MAAYYYLAKMKVLNSLNYRFEVLSTIATNLILLMASVFLWRTAFQGIDSVDGVNEAQMVSYVVVSALLSTIFSFNVQGDLQDRIREGEIAVDLIKPISLLGKLFAEDIGSVITGLVNKLIPLAVIALFFVKVSTPPNLLYVLLFIMSIVLCYLILWSFSAIFSLLTFWFMDLGNITGIKDVIIRLLSGSIIPIWFFPSGLRKIFSFLPFQYTYQTPLSIYIGKLSVPDAWTSIAIQCIWAVVFYVVLYLMWLQAQKHINVQGG